MNLVNVETCLSDIGLEIETINLICWIFVWQSLVEGELYHFSIENLSCTTSHLRTIRIFSKIQFLFPSLQVDRRYRQYYHQMQIIVSSFDTVAGTGAAKPYTTLALQTISRHFRCLRDAINGQIHVARKGLGEEDSLLNEKGVGISRLRFVDQQLRQQRALQQLGMMQQHAWRPQRGLPESSVSILRAWLFEHFLHPLALLTFFFCLSFLPYSTFFFSYLATWLNVLYGFILQIPKGFG